MSAAHDDLWMVQAIIHGFKLDVVALALQQEAAFPGMTVLQAEGLGRREPVPRGAEERPLSVEWDRRVALQMVVGGRADAQTLAEVLARHAHTGRHGDGHVFLWRVESAIAIREFHGTSSVPGNRP